MSGCAGLGRCKVPLGALPTCGPAVATAAAAPAPFARPLCCPTHPCPASSGADVAVEVPLFKEGATLVSFIYPAQNKELVDALAARRMTVLGERAVGWTGCWGFGAMLD